MTGVPVGLVIGLIDALDQSTGGPGIVDRADEKLFRYIRSDSATSGQYPVYRYGTKYLDHTGRDRYRHRYRSRRRGGPSGRYPTHRNQSRYPGPRRRGPYRGKGRSRCPPGHYWSFKHRRCMKSKFR